MVKLILPSLAEHMSNLYNISCDLADTVLICKDGKLHQNRVVVQLMFKMLDIDHDSECDIMIIMPEFSMQEIQQHIHKMFGIRTGGDNPSDKLANNLSMAGTALNESYGDNSERIDNRRNHMLRVIPTWEYSHALY